MDMKFGIWNMKLSLVLVSAMLLCLFGLTFDTDAQTKKRKKTTQIVVPQPTPPPLGVPIIISRAEDIPSESQVIVPQNLPEPTPTMEQVRPTKPCWARGLVKSFSGSVFMRPERSRFLDERGRSRA